MVFFGLVHPNKFHVRFLAPPEILEVVFFQMGLIKSFDSLHQESFQVVSMNERYVYGLDN